MVRLKKKCDRCKNQYNNISYVKGEFICHSCKKKHEDSYFMPQLQSIDMVESRSRLVRRNGSHGIVTLPDWLIGCTVKVEVVDIPVVNDLPLIKKKSLHYVVLGYIMNKGNLGTTTAELASQFKMNSTRMYDVIKKLKIKGLIRTVTEKRKLKIFYIN